MIIPVELMQLLSEVGYMACFRGDVERAKIIMDGVSAVGEEQAPIKMGVAVTKIYAGELDDAITLLRDDVLASDPDHSSAKTFLGIALNLKGDHAEANVLFQDVAENGNPDEQSIAQVYLNN